MDASNTAKLRQAIALAMGKNPQAREAEIASLVERRESSLLRAWARERLTLLVRAHMQGLSDPGEQLPLPGGGRITLAMATIVDLRRSLKMTRHKAREKAQRTASLIEEMWPYAKTRRGLTVERYCELRAAGVKPHTSKSVRKNLFDDDE